MQLSEQDQQFEAQIVAGLRTDMRNHGDFEWDEALSDSESDAFEECAWVITNLDEIGNCTPERAWYYDTFEDNNTLFAEWIEKWFGPRWGKIAQKVEW